MTAAGAERRFRVTVTLAGPVLTRSTAAGAYGVDAPVAREPDGRPVLPGTLVKGRLREAWEELATAPGDPLALTGRVAEWLGAGEGEPGSGGHRRGRLLLSDFRCLTDGEGVRHRIQVDPELGAVRPHAFQTVETPFAAGEVVRFEGEVRFIPREPSEVEALERCLTAGLRWIDGLGALRTVGFGRLQGAEVELEPPEPGPAAGAAVPTEGAEEQVLDVAFTPEAPFCVSRPQPVENLFESAVALPGGSLKGALAAGWREVLGLAPDGAVTEDLDPERPELARHFARVRFTHAFPASRETMRRPVAPALSLVKVKVKVKAPEDLRVLHDVLLCPGPGLVRTASGWRAPVFAPDWKERRDVDERFGWPGLRRELRVRTAIDRRTRRAASEQLFALETVLPEEGIAWLGRIDLRGLEDAATRKAVRSQLLELLERLGRGLRSVGKTKARVALEVLPAGGATDAVSRRDGQAPEGRAVLLQTPALLCDPTRLREAAAGEALRAAYEAAWDELSGGSLRLVRFFAAQELAGGEYLRHRFQAGRDYEPYLLTRAGSVFLLEPVPGREEAAEEALARWDRQGLPVPGWAAERFAPGVAPEALWQHLPYVPENGYGEVALDRAIHWEARPAAEELQALDGAAPEGAP